METSQGLTVSEQKRLEAVERDVKRAMKEAIDSTRKGPKEHSRVLLASDLARLLLIASIALAACGCGSTAGWRVSFGVSPVNAISDSQELTKESVRNPQGKY